MIENEELGRKIREAFDKGTKTVIITMVDGKLSATMQLPRKKSGGVLRSNATIRLEPGERAPRPLDSFGRVTKRNEIFRWVLWTLQELAESPQMRRILGGSKIFMLPSERTIKIILPNGWEPMYLSLADARSAREAREHIRRKKWKDSSVAERRFKLRKKEREVRRLQDPDYQRVVEEERVNLWSRRKRKDV